jgi:phosphohistidine phosphatase
MGQTMNVTRYRHRLIIMRHAKAGELPGGPDFERALKARGRRDSSSAGKWLQASGFRPDAVICSAARRTRQTWQYVSAELSGQPAFSSERALYMADSEDVIDMVKQTAEDVPTLLYIGHNPAASGVVGLLAGTEPVFPTSAIAVLGVNDAWAHLAAGDGELLASWTPHDVA